MYPLILEEYNLEIPRELSSTVITGSLIFWTAILGKTRVTFFRSECWWKGFLLICADAAETPDSLSFTKKGEEKSEPEVPLLLFRPLYNLNPGEDWHYRTDPALSWAACQRGERMDSSIFSTCIVPVKMVKIWTAAIVIATLVWTGTGEEKGMCVRWLEVEGTWFLMMCFFETV